MKGGIFDRKGRMHVHVCVIIGHLWLSVLFAFAFAVAARFVPSGFRTLGDWIDRRNDMHMKCFIVICTKETPLCQLIGCRSSGDTKRLP